MRKYLTNFINFASINNTKSSMVLLQFIVVFFGGEMSQQQQKKKADKQGRNKLRCAHYKAERRLEFAKLRRVLRSNGVRAAREWSETNDAKAVLASLANRRTKLGLRAAAALRG